MAGARGRRPLRDAEFSGQQRIRKETHRCRRRSSRPFALDKSETKCAASGSEPAWSSGAAAFGRKVRRNLPVSITAFSPRGRLRVEHLPALLREALERGSFQGGGQSQNRRVGQELPAARFRAGAFREVWCGLLRRERQKSCSRTSRVNY